MKNETLNADIQLTILELICEGWSIENIALHLNISEKSVSVYA